MQSLRRLQLTAMGAALAAAFGMSLPAHADTFGFNGYFRAGPGTTSNSSNGGSARQCYNLPGVDAGHYRLGNECNFYGEFGFNDYGSVGTAKYHNEVMINEYSPSTDIGKSSSSFEQMYGSVSGVDFAPEVHFWAGKRFYGRANIDMLDHFFVRMDGVGGGADHIALGSGGAKLGLAYFGSDSYAGFGDGGNDLSQQSGRRFNVDVTDIPVNPGGTLRITGTLTKSNSVGGTSGDAISFQHNQKLPQIGGGNVLWVQYARGSASLAQNFGSSNSPTSAAAWRIADALDWQAGRFGGQANVVYGHHDAGATGNATGGTFTDANNVTHALEYTNGAGIGTVAYTNSSLGARFTYALTGNLRVIGQFGHMTKKPNGMATETLNIETIGLGIVPDAYKYYSRPEIRLYVTHGSWNQAAALDPANYAYNGDNGLAGATFGVNGSGGYSGVSAGSTSGTSVGLQVEAWF